jgi:hypothetical protein
MVDGFALMRAATLARALKWTVEEVITAAVGRGLAALEEEYLPG